MISNCALSTVSTGKESIDKLANIRAFQSSFANSEKKYGNVSFDIILHLQVII